MPKFRAYDLLQRYPSAPPLLVEIFVAACIIALASGARLMIDRFVPGVVAFPLTFPALAAATFLAGGRSGLLVIAGCQILAWYFLLRVKGSFVFASAADAASLVLATCAQLLLLWFVVSYRRTERTYAELLRTRGGELEQTVALLRQQADAGEQLLVKEAALQASRGNLEAIYQASGDGLALCQAIFDEDGHVREYQVLEVNQAHAELTSATREQMLTMPVSTIYPPTNPIWFETAEKVLKTGVMHDFDIRSRANGRWLNIRVSRVSDTLFQQTFVDVSERYRHEEERRALLKEMSHRVMNNFQMIAGFLRIQAVSADPAAKAQLLTAEGRVQVLARLHSLLAYTESEGTIDAAEYVRQLCSYLQDSFERPDAVSLVCEAGELSLPTDTVVPLGFVISELVTNSAKYAYPPPMTGTVRVSLFPQPDGWKLTIQDKGRGLGDTATGKPGGLGTLLVKRFVQQIDAVLVTTSDGGVRHEIIHTTTR